MPKLNPFERWQIAVAETREYFNKIPYGSNLFHVKEYREGVSWLEGQFFLYSHNSMCIEKKEILMQNFKGEYGIWTRAIAQREAEKKREQEEFEEELKRDVVKRWLMTDTFGMGGYVPANVYRELCKMYPNIYTEDLKSYLFLVADVIFRGRSRDQDPRYGLKYMVTHEVNTMCDVSTLERNTRYYDLRNLCQIITDGMSGFADKDSFVIIQRYNLKKGTGLKSMKDVSIGTGYSETEVKTIIGSYIRRFYTYMTRSGLYREIVKVKE